MGFDFLPVLIVLILKINSKFIKSFTPSPLGFLIILAGGHSISDVHITGPAVLENGRQQWVDLACSFTFASAEYKQLDIKWYFDSEVSQMRH